jgi:hypothetical protein
MRDLIREMTNGKMGQITKLIKEIRETGNDLELLKVKEQKPGLPPKLRSEVETELYNGFFRLRLYYTR